MLFFLVLNSFLCKAERKCGKQFITFDPLTWKYRNMMKAKCCYKFAVNFMS